METQGNISKKNVSKNVSKNISKNFANMFKTSNKRSSEKEKLINQLVAMNQKLYGNIDRSQSPIPVISALLIILSREQDDIIERQKKIVPFLEKYQKILDNFADNSVKIETLKELTSLAAELLQKNKSKNKGSANIYPTLVPKTRGSNL